MQSSWAGLEGDMWKGKLLSPPVWRLSKGLITTPLHNSVEPVQKPTGALCVTQNCTTNLVHIYIIDINFGNFSLRFRPLGSRNIVFIFTLTLPSLTMFIFLAQNGRLARRVAEWNSWRFWENFTVRNVWRWQWLSWAAAWIVCVLINRSSFLWNERQIQ